MLGRLIGRFSPLWVQVSVFAAILVLGTIGMERSRPDSDIADSLYRALQLFTLEMNVKPDWKPDALLQVVRFLAAAFSILTIVTLASRRFANWVRKVLQSFDDDRLIFIGYGQVNRALLRHHVSSGARCITVVDQEFTAADRREARRIGTLLVEADITRPEVIAALNPGRAARIYVASGSDARNLEVGMIAAREIEVAHRYLPGHTREQSHRRYGCPPGRDEIVMVHAASPKFMSDLARGRDIDFVLAHGLRFFSFKTAVAAALVARARFPERATDLGLEVPHLVIAGAGEMAQAIFEQALTTAVSAAGVPRFTIVDRNAESACARFVAHYPRLFDGSLPDGTFPEPRFLTAELDSICFEANPDLDALDALDCPPTAWIFTCRNDETNIEAALRLENAMQALARRPVPIFARAWEGRLGTAGRGLGLTHLFGQAHDHGVCERVAGDTFDWLARAIHEGYGFDAGFRALAKQAGGRDGQEYRDHWARLPAHIQRANMSAAMHLPQRLHDLGFDWRGRGDGRVPLLPANTPLATKLAAEAERSGAIDPSLERTAATEHLRWMIDRALNGWRYGKTRSNRRRQHPDMVESAQLGGDVKRLDLTALRVAFGLRQGDFPEMPPQAHPIALAEMDVERIVSPGPNTTCLRIHIGRTQARLEPEVQAALQDLVTAIRDHPTVCKLHVVLHGESEVQIGRREPDTGMLVHDETRPFLRWLSELCAGLPDGIVVDLDFRPS